MYTQKSFVARKEDADKKWWVIDATDVVVGRLASEVATLLRGKHKPTFTPNQECGDFVVVTNADKIRFTGDKLNKKNYYWHTGFIGGIKSKTAREMMEKTPDRVVSEAVKGMLPKTSLGRKQLTKLKVFAGAEHSHEAQKPEKYEING
ncbi:MAG: 50S ribosomal protein L13 [Halobacteriovoraceae bacterium]|nr:50S ribosomal protein L13 [Halobacteriovoraceae bacterium]|tara:strand:+ start:130098 stop:130541 length:444 start_codon:yes stop_codon:yes gene_type:complete